MWRHVTLARFKLADYRFDQNSQMRVANATMNATVNATMNATVHESVATFNTYALGTPRSSQIKVTRSSVQTSESTRELGNGKARQNNKSESRQGKR